jgi:HEAT repeat protein
MSVDKSVIEGSVLLGNRDELVERAIKSKRAFAAIVNALSGDDRSQRVLAARVVHGLAKVKPELLKERAADLADALDRPEAQTRWEILGTLEKLVDVDARVIDKALTQTTTALHDADSGVVRLAAFRVLTAYGATTAKRSEKVWPLIDEALRVYHGDPEFPQMLSGVIRLMAGAASDEVKLAAADRMQFDSEHAKGLLGRRAKKIVDCAPRKRRRKKVE